MFEYKINLGDRAKELGMKYNIIYFGDRAKFKK